MCVCVCMYIYWPILREALNQLGVGEPFNMCSLHVYTKTEQDAPPA